MLKIKRMLCTFPTEICDLTNIYAHNVKNHPCQEVEDGYIFKNSFVKIITI